MAKRVKAIVKKEVETDLWRHEICDNCAFGTWNTWTEWNRDYLGRPITLRCPHYKEGKFGIVRGSQACYRFAPKKPTSV